MKKKTRFYKTEKKTDISNINSDAPSERKCGYYQVNPEVTTIYVGNLKFNKTEKQVQELFGRFGSVKYSKIVLDQKTGKGKQNTPSARKSLGRNRKKENNILPGSGQIQTGIQKKT